jgi:heat shock protein HslJ
MKFKFLVFFVVISIFLAGCQSETASSENTAIPVDEMAVEKEVVVEKETSPAPPADTFAITSSNLSRIAGVQWNLQEMILEGQSVPLAELKPYLKISDKGKVNGSTSVNIFMGSVEVDAEGVAKWSPLSSTMMAGSEDRMKQEAAYMKILPATTQIDLDSGCLKLSDAEGQSLLIFQAKAD